MQEIMKNQNCFISSWNSMLNHRKLLELCWHITLDHFTLSRSRRSLYNERGKKYKVIINLETLFITRSTYV